METFNNSDPSISSREHSCCKIAITLTTPFSGVLSTNLQVQAETKPDGSFNLADLPIGTYEVTFSKEGFEAAVYPQIAEIFSYEK